MYWTPEQAGPCLNGWKGQWASPRVFTVKLTSLWRRRAVRLIGGVPSLVGSVHRLLGTFVRAAHAMQVARIELLIAVVLARDNSRGPSRGDLFDRLARRLGLLFGSIPSHFQTLSGLFREGEEETVASANKGGDDLCRLGGFPKVGQ